MLNLNKIYLVCIALGLIYLLHPMRVSAGDTQYWNEFIFENDITQQLVLETALEQQFVNEISDFALYNITVEPSYKTSDKMSFGLGYRYEREKENEVWATENRYWVHHSVKWQLTQSRIKLKSKFEYRDLEGTDYWRFRSKLKYQREVKINSSKITPFLSIEPFYDFSKDKWNQIRSVGGLSFTISKQLEGSLYYLNLAKRGNDAWNETNVFGTELVFSF